LVVLVVSVGSVVVSVGSVVVSVGSVVVVVVGVLPVSPELESFEQVSEPLASVDCVVGVSPELVVWVEPSVGQVVTCVSAPASAPSVPLTAPAVDVSVESKLSLVATRTRLVAWVLAALWVVVTACVVAGRVTGLAVWVTLTACNRTGAAVELKAIRRERTTVTCALK
jgi:hypothetical protein